MSSGSRFWRDGLLQDGLLPDDLWIAVLLSGTAGFADAVGYVKSGVFAANMTGNTVLAGLSLADGKWDVALQRGMTLAAFCVGVAAASLSLRLSRGRSAVTLVGEAVLVLASALAEARLNLSIALIAAAMGMQAVAVTRFRSVVASTVVITNSMARLSEFGLGWCIARAEARATAAKTAPSLLASIWAAYGLGAVGAAFAMRVMAEPLLVPAAMLVLVAALLGLKGSRT
jgi:uncharacterized membrane protein YoaK (UPF0700 family)